MVVQGAHAKKRSRTGLVPYIAVICALLIALGGLGLYAWQKVERLQQSISDTQSELTDASKQIAQQQETIDEQKDKIKDQKDTIASQKEKLEDQKDTIKDQKDTIKDQKGEIEDLKEQVALKTKTTKSTKKTKPAAQNLPPEGENNPYKGQKIVALTFDDGPGPYTERLLNEMKARGVRATFFVLGTRVDAYPKLIRRMAKEGHVLGNHSNAHNMLHRMSLDGVRNEMGKCAAKIEKILGYRPPVMRCPGGNSSSLVQKYAKEAGVPIINWSVDTRDWESRNKAAILKVCKNNIRDGSIVLLHDIHKVSVDASIELMDWLLEEGYTMVTVPELLKARRGGITAGKTYY